MYSHFGYNLKVTDLQAAIGCEQLKKFPGFIEKRKKNWERLRKALEPAEEKLILPEPVENGDPSWFGFLISVRPESGLNRNDVTKYIESHNVQTRLLFSGNLIRHPCFGSHGSQGSQRDGSCGSAPQEPSPWLPAYRVVGSLEVTDFVMNNSFWVGVYPGMTDEKLDYMAKVILEAVG